MKIRIVDLMDYYYGEEGAKLAASRRVTPRSKTELKAVPQSQTRPKPRQTPRHGFRNALYIAASFLVVLEIAGALIWGFGPGRNARPGDALQEGASVTEPMLSELPSQTPEASLDSLIQPEILQAGVDTVDNITCYGNMLIAEDGSYYAMEAGSLQTLETTNVHTTINLYGEWEVDFDYAVVDGALVLHDNTVSSNETTAQAEPIPGRIDTVKLTLRRPDQSRVETCRYPVFYQIETGGISDPLANVSELFDHGNVSSVQFNSSLTRAIVKVFGVEETASGGLMIGDAATYLCDLETGQMQKIIDLVEQYLTGEYVSDGQSLWADDDNLLFWAIQSEQGVEAAGNEENAGGQLHELLLSYNVAAGQLNYSVKDVSQEGSILNYNQEYISKLISENNQYTYKLLETASGRMYTIDGAAFEEITGDLLDKTANQSAYCADDGTLYLVDHSRRAYARLNDVIAMPSEPITWVILLSDNFLCLVTEANTYCYHIPEDVSMTPLTEEPSETPSVEAPTETDASASQEDLLALTSNQTDAQLYVPAQFQNEVQMDTPFETDIGEDYIDPAQVDNAIFSFFDNSQITDDRSGLVWIITIYPIEDLEAILNNDEFGGDLHLMLNHHVLGTDQEHVYALFCLGTTYDDTRQYELGNMDSIRSYYEHADAGMKILEDFVEKNNLEIPEGSVDWKEWYQHNIIQALQEQMG